MSSYDKVVKLACKPKAAPPKAKYIDPIIAATWSEDGAVHDVCKALSPKFREPNAIVVFKALIVLHTMIRNGATDNVLSHLSSSEVLRLQNVSAGTWEGYAAPENLQNYAAYLDSRIKAYHDLKHDAIRVQAESNRDLRNNSSIEEDAYQSGSHHRGKNGASSKPAPSGPTRSKTIMGRKLRVMTVEKGLLRETRVVQKMIDTLVECRFYLDDLEDELTTTALRMLVKDLLILFQAGNEGVINVLEHYFEMSHVDAEQALAIYRYFCKQTEKVVEYLGVAKKLQNLLNVPIPNLKHAPVSLAGALQEYLDDSNFEQNRIEYKTNKDAVDRGGRKGASSVKKSASSKPASPPPPMPSQPTTSAPAASSSTNTDAAIIDFFNAIEDTQPTMFNPQTNSPNTAYFQQQSIANPFQQMTGQPYGQQPQLQGQPTGFLMPQQTAFQQAPNPFGLQANQQRQLQPQATGHRPFSSYLPPQGTGFPQTQPQQVQPQQTGFLQPQTTGANPFRQSMLFPQTTGMAMFGVGSGMGSSGSQGSFQSPNGMNSMNGFNGMTAAGQGQTSPMTQNGAAPSSAFAPSPSVGTPFGQMGQTSPMFNMPARPASTPLTSFGGGSSTNPSSPPAAQPVKTHQTGTRNPFGPVSTPAPPVPKQPTLMELTMGFGGPNGAMNGQQQQQQQQPQPTGMTGGMNGNLFSSSALSPGATDMSGIASSFAHKSNSAGSADPNSNIPSFSSSNFLTSQPTSSTATGSTFSDSLFSSSLSTQPTGATNASSIPSFSISPTLKPQSTGFGGVKPFKPSSSFGASLLDSLPPIPGSAPTTPAVTGGGPSANPPFGSGGGAGSGGSGFNPGSAFSVGNHPTGFGGASGQTGSTLGQGLRPQMTGSAANPFRASMLATGGTPNFGTGTPGLPSSNSHLSAFGGMTGIGGSSASPSASMGGGLYGAGGGGFQSNVGQGVRQQQQQPTGSLI